MGNTCETDLTIPNDNSIFNPIELDFKRVQPVIIPPGLNQALNSISTLAFI